MVHPRHFMKENIVKCAREQFHLVNHIIVILYRTDFHLCVINAIVTIMFFQTQFLLSIR